MLTLLFEPAVVASTLIALAIALFSNRLARTGEFLISQVSVAPGKVRTRIRVARWRYRRRLLLAARSDFRVTYALIRAAVFQLMFFFTIGLYFLLITGELFKGIGNLPVPVQLFLSSPIYIFEALWLLQSERAKNLAKAAERRSVSRSELCHLRRVPW